MISYDHCHQEDGILRILTFEEFCTYQLGEKPSGVIKSSDESKHENDKL